MTEARRHSGRFRLVTLGSVSAVVLGVLAATPSAAQNAGEGCTVTARVELPALEDMTPEQRQRLWQLLTPEQKGDFLRNLTPEQRAGLAAQMTPEQRERLRERLRDDRERRDIDGSMRGRLSADERHRLREQIIEAQRERREALHRHGGRFDRPPERADK